MSTLLLILALVTMPEPEPEPPPSPFPDEVPSTSAPTKPEPVEEPE